MESKLNKIEHRAAKLAETIERARHDLGDLLMAAEDLHEEQETARSSEVLHYVRRVEREVSFLEVVIQEYYHDIHEDEERCEDEDEV